MNNTVAARTLNRQEFDSLEQEAFLNLWRTYDRLRIIEDEFFQPFGLTPQQYNALRLLRAEHPQTVPTLQLAANLVSRAPDITRLLDKLETSGWIARERLRENRRVVQVGITKPGLTLLRKIDDQLAAYHARQLGHLSASELQALVKLLKAARSPHDEEGNRWM